MNCNVAITMMHDYLDDDLSRGDTVSLKKHLLACPDCRKRFEQLEQAEAYTQASMSFVAHGSSIMAAGPSAQLKARIMQQLPKPPVSQSWLGWVRRHPAITVAAMFIAIMLSSFVAMWEQDQELVIRGNDIQQLVVEGHTVIIPENVVVNGDLTIENGTMEVFGEINGNLTIIDGTVNMASTAKIIGESREITQAMDWIWYKVRQTFSGLTN